MLRLSLAVLLLVAVVSAAMVHMPIPDTYSPPTPPDGNPTCQYQNQTYPYYFKETCSQTSPGEYCEWTYDEDCRRNGYCPTHYDISCSQIDGSQTCVWTYTMDCPSTPPPAQCPWTYEIQCS
ncbi:hypothetical protein KIPB_009060 [Kipferlia bialata]|uniref:Chitin-binding type-2 domain-containing protein n=1 Tax=Kipferlia bialata TaxID=797122 RepID=A0A9K3GLY2_9EUKA|nr:hypothetical protein KIPB_009060 [Kipferlia bialata]|eukprot:g9060.t1